MGRSSLHGTWTANATLRADPGMQAVALITADRRTYYLSSGGSSTVRHVTLVAAPRSGEYSCTNM